MARMPGETLAQYVGRRALNGERTTDLAAETGLSDRQVRRYAATARRAAEAAGLTGGGQGQVSGQVADGPGGPMADSRTAPADAGGHPRARVTRVGPVAASIAAAMTGIASLLEHDVGVLVELKEPGRLALTDSEHARSAQAWSKALVMLAQAAPDIAAGVGEHMAAVTDISAEPDPQRRMEMLRDYALSWGQTGTAMRAEDAMRRAQTGGDTVRVVVETAEAGAHLDRLVDD